MVCWRCGAPWRCSRCGSFQQRPNGKGCAECHRRAQRERKALRALELDTFQDIVITPPARRYLKAFTAYLMAGKTGDSSARRAASRAKRVALRALEGPP